MRSPIVVIGAAMAAPNGLDAVTVSDSVRAGINMTSTVNVSGEMFIPLVIGTVPDTCFFPLKPDIAEQQLTSRETRLIQLAGLLGPEIKTIRLPGSITPHFIVGLPENLSRPELVLDLMAHQLDLAVESAHCKAITQGRASGLTAVHEACLLLDSGQAHMVIAGGIDTYNDIDVLGFLHNDSRIKTDTSIDQFTPGEGACLLYLMTEETARYLALPYFCRITSTAVGFEQGHLYSEFPLREGGLSQTFQALISKAAAPPKAITTVFSSMNGESYWAKEWSLAFIRNRSLFHEEVAMHHPAQFYGDPGAASGPLMMGCVLKGFEYDYYHGSTLIYASSDYGQRSAVLVEGGPEIRQKTTMY